MKEMERAKKILKEQNATCVLCKGEAVIVSHKKGIAPVMELIGAKINLCDFSVADKVVGKAVAMLFILAGIKKVWADVISKNAVSLFEEHNIEYSYEKLCDTIVSANGGICPMENAVKDLTNPEQAYIILKKALEVLKK